MGNYTEKEALEYLVGLGQTEVLEIDGKKFTTNQVYKVKEPTPAAITVTTLTALVDYIKSGIDSKYSGQNLIHVVSPERVEFYSELREDKDRENYISVKALLPNNIYFNGFTDPEEFNIMLQSSFIDNKDRALLLKVVGNIKDSAVKQVGDDGVSQAATIKTGVASVNNVVVPNPVVLAPYRTFPEIEQPESKFIFRMQSGPAAALFEADGGAWRNEAMGRIKKYLEEQLKDVQEVKIIS
ncbi:hypothetical protein [Clostridium sp. HV4-5-A1G]|uniref:hypothetical protein n=1 Tax=Clostridium sp. HV4-5-A1G TaxID=2004595 RepID=UPI00123ADD7C|nr:hypothetical protein [Clostridium sp. HV4-5-A1G]KAA8676181.1 hypothetical protein F3O63_03660 [Clostridium sp. HV4-5-A1G]